MRFIAPFLLGFIVAGCQATTQGGRLYVASWNVENLFDTVDDPDVNGDEEYTPSGTKAWTDEKLKRGLQNLARVIKDMNGKKGPDILGLCEVENRLVLAMLIKELASLKRDYRIIHKDSPSNRGIDCAMIYDARVLQAAFEGFHLVPAGNTRDIVEADFRIADKRLRVFMNHWPARSNPEKNRIIAARTLRKRLDAILAVEPNADIVVMGDFNDYPTNVSIREHLRTGADPGALKAGELYNTMWPIHNQNKGSYVFQNRWEVIDHIMISPGLLDQKAFRWKADSTQAIMFDYQIFTPKKGNQIPRPNRKYSGNTYHRSGISDHLPIGCVVEY
ncbi:MAG: hypothetical protein FJ271_28420 [Planctomycetes bacterium]|nr:hypothetical protein [Planctomycetota bacterium]